MTESPSQVDLTDIDVEFVTLPATDALQRKWQDLEIRSNGSFYVGWSWIGSWIESLGGAVELRLLRARLKDRTVGLCLFAPSVERRHRLISSRTLRLHATGRPHFDILTVECNGFLAEREIDAIVGQRMVDHLVNEQRNWDELVFICLRDNPKWRETSVGGLRQRIRVDANYYVDLAAVRDNEGDYLGLLGATARSQIRRSAKEYEKFGPLSVHLAQDEGQALTFLDGLKEMHQAYWVARGQPGAFSNAFFEQFHQRLVRHAFSRGEMQLLAVDAGAKRLGYLYNFVYRGHVYNYQSGLDYEICERHNRPGMVAHVKAIEFNTLLGHRIYDFLAGDVQYKKTLGTVAAQMTWVTLQRDLLRFHIEDAARRLVERWR